MADGPERLNAVVAVDHEARQSAALARQQINKHEEHCGERWKAAHDTMGELKASIEKLHRRINDVHKMLLWFTISVLGVALSLAAFAAVQWLLARGVAQ
jgi:hypothetical protein